MIDAGHAPDVIDVVGDIGDGHARRRVRLLPHLDAGANGRLIARVQRREALAFSLLRGRMPHAVRRTSTAA